MYSNKISFRISLFQVRVVIFFFYSISFCFSIVKMSKIFVKGTAINESWVEFQ